MKFLLSGHLVNGSYPRVEGTSSRMKRGDDRKIRPERRESHRHSSRTEARSAKPTPQSRTQEHPEADIDADIRIAITHPTARTEGVVVGSGAALGDDGRLLTEARGPLENVVDRSAVGFNAAQKKSGHPELGRPIAMPSFPHYFVSRRSKKSSGIVTITEEENYGRRPLPQGVRSNPN